ncbi:hypothetical protein PtA15_1A139 [Puccinia triticina]|uniref:Uncharacterized protein n=1 Tax=Puccinia triticina TaxID=208348 RepID=A0ABY7C9H0_9BASI|nr:uncharacterized protein PtA15_1A139 [Puccinia triticina]WAQ80801.1 hypothetical protein PtA15_1A139 [Puccinia triticina]WAR51693.1 hypothetical protein PtB15_1B129 [Puccinia triticina]
MTGKNSRDIKSSYLIQRSCPAKLSLVTYRPTTSTELNDSDNLADHHLPDPSANLSLLAEEVLKERPDQPHLTLIISHRSVPVCDVQELSTRMAKPPP